MSLAKQKFSLFLPLYPRRQRQQMSRDTAIDTAGPNSVAVSYPILFDSYGSGEADRNGDPCPYVSTSLNNPILYIHTYIHTYEKAKTNTYRSSSTFSDTWTGLAVVAGATPRLSALDLDLGTNVPVSAILPPRSTLSLRLPLLPFPHLVPPAADAPVPAPIPLSTPAGTHPRDPRRLNGSTGDVLSRCGKYDTTGDPYDDDNDGGGTLGYVNACTPDTAYGGPTPPECTDDDDGGVVNCVPLLNTLLPAGATGENGNGDSIDEGECESGVVVSDDVLFSGRRIEDDGRGIGTPCDGIGTACVVAGRAAGYPTDVIVGDDSPDVDRRCVGCENGSTGVNPTKLSTDNPSCPSPS